MQIKAIKTEKIMFKQDINELISKQLLDIKENTIIAITSKIVSICEGQEIPKNSITKHELIQKEAEIILADDQYEDFDIVLTIKNGLLIPSAGIDESNANGTYILYPKDPFKSAKNIWRFFTQKYSIKNFGVLITDSHTTPLRKGVTGIALSWYGFEPLYNYIGEPDIYGKSLRVTKVNIADALAAAAVFVMGEGSEQTPIALLTDIPKITFTEKETSVADVHIKPTEDIYYPLLKNKL